MSFSLYFLLYSYVFGRKYRVKAARKLVSELKALQSRPTISLSLRCNMIFSPLIVEKVLEFCEEVRQCSFSWTCSARIDLR